MSGFNAALYFVGMDANTGAAGVAPATVTPRPSPAIFCSEMDVLEANTQAQQYTRTPAPTRAGRSAPHRSAGNGSPSSVATEDVALTLSATGPAPPTTRRRIMRIGMTEEAADACRPSQ